MASKWIVRHNVPVLDEHTLKDEDGDVLCKVGKRKLQKICNVNNARIKATGDETPIVIGHTDDNSPEHLQPEIVGFARNYHVGPLFRTGRSAIHATFRFKRNARAKVAKYPRRSVELWLSDWKIDPISLLGATTPERDLGLLRLSRAGRRKYRRICPMQPDAANVAVPPDAKPSGSAGNTGVAPDQNLVQAVVAALMETDVFKWIRSQMEQAQSEPAEPEPGAMESPEEGDVGADDFDNGDEADLDDEGDEDDADVDDEDDGEDDEDVDEEDDERPERYSAVAPSGTNTSIPGSKIIKPQYSKRNKTERVRMSRDPNTALAQAQKRLDVQDRAIASLRIKYQRAEREKDLMKIEGEGVILDLKEELDAVEAMSPRMYRRHIDRIRHRYSRSPINVDVDSLMEHSRSGITAKLTKQRSMEIAAYAAKRNVSFEAALEELEGVTQE